MSKPLGGSKRAAVEAVADQAQSENVAGSSDGQVANPSPPPARRPAARAAAPAKADGGHEVEVQWFRVLEDGEVSNKSGRTRMPKGKVIRSTSYDIGQLVASGVKLEPCEEPAWSVAARESGEVEDDAVA